MNPFKQLFSRRRLYTDLSDEIEAHLEEKIEELVQSGMSRKNAVATARREFGNLTLIEEESREVWQWPTIESFLADLRYGIRMLRRNPAFGLTAILILAVGIGANAAVFSIVDSILLKPLPYADQERLMMVRDVGDRDTRTPMSYPEFLGWKDQNQIFESVGAYSFGSVDLTSPGEPQHFDIIRASAELLPMLGTIQRLGRGFTAQEELRAGPPAVIISDSFWHSRFHGDPSALGGKLSLNNTLFTIVGVLPPDFHFATDPDLILPLRLDTESAAPHFNSLQVVGKLRPGMTLPQARGAATAAVKQVNDRASSFGGASVYIAPLRDFLIGDSRPLLVALLGTVAFVLLIACANTANLLLARAAARQKEIAIRISLGAARMRLIRQLLTESLLLSVLGGVIGLAIARWGLVSLVKLLGDRLPHSSDVHLDGYVLAFTAALSIFTGILFGLAPALQVGNGNLVDRLKIGGRLSAGLLNAQLMRNVLIVAEIAFSLVLLAGAGLLLRSFIRLAHVDKGFDPDHVLTMHIAVSPGKYAEPKREINYLNQIVESTRNLPGVDSVGFITNLPFSGDAISGDFLIQGVAIDPANVSAASKQFVVGDYFSAMHMPLIRGRFLNSTDTNGSRPVVVVDQSFVRQYFSRNDPIGKHIDVGWGKRGWSEIVGVVGEAREFAMTANPIPTIYSPMVQKPELFEFLAFNLAVRTKLDPLSQIQVISDQIHQLDSTQVISKARTMEDLIDSKLASRRDPVWLFGTFSAIALFLAAIGIYGLLSYYVLQRKSEIGTRIALGAQNADILRLILGHAAKLVIAGMAIGLAVSFAVVRALSSLLFGVQPTDLPTFLGVSALLAFLALVACGVPALRATRMDPSTVLRNE
jgi:putative ABC transport system permease protein